uniref:Seminal fluid protein CSSFP020 n=1 Tax=Chilo suppressalis TaxID=168631 RepID=G9F9H2_CHISP|nr:seminal fluid protein CSSFP020 [Chilo suppressalis]
MVLVGVYLFSLSFLSSAKGWTDTKQRSFREGFLFGAGTSAYQVEGAWNEDDKGESMWDRFTHEHPEVIEGATNGDVASDSYHFYHRDVEMLRELGVDHYRFSIAWSRILPTGLSNKVNEKGLKYYDNLIYELIKYNIEPVVTMYHMDLPNRLQDLGGWANPLSVEWFVEYATILFERYSSKVKYWVTINQPNKICMDGYGDHSMAPGINMKGIADYLCVKNIMLAHAKAYRLYEKNYKANNYKGLVGIALSMNWAEPVNNKTENVKATDDYRAFTIGLYMDPIWSAEGGFPKVVRDTIAKKGKEKGFSKSRLPELSAEEMALLKGAADFLGMNHYTTFLVQKGSTDYESPSFLDDVNVDLTQGKDWKKSRSSWLEGAPFGLYKIYLYINQKYDYPKTFITEHGWFTKPGIGDQSRVDNLRGYLFALQLAMEDGADVIGYTAWSFMDNVEWTAGISERFGLYEVAFDSEEKKRTARMSALVYKRIIETRIIEENWTPDSMNIQISNRRTNKNKVEL